MSNKKEIIALGEILWDVFPDRICFGGAPANYACAAAEMSGSETRVKLLSGVGSDELGQQALEQLSSHGVHLDLVQQNGFATGQVDVTLNSSGGAQYVFKDNVAWDNLEWSDALGPVANSADVVCFGSLGQRNEKSSKVIRQFVGLTRKECWRVFDINLRFPHVVDSSIVRSLELANVLKLNDEELPYLSNLVKAGGQDQQGQIDWIRKEFDLKLVAMTLGKKGALLRTENDCVISIPPAVKVVDTVGAGDAFTAMLSLFLLDSRLETQEWDLKHIAERCNEIASFVCTQPGATPTFPQEWKFESNRK